MSGIVKRLLTFIIGVPAIIALVFFLPFCKHLPFNIFIVLLSAVGAVELSSMLEKKHIHISKIESFILGALAPSALTLTISFNLPEILFPLFVIAGAMCVLLSRAFFSREKMGDVIGNIAGGFSVLVYPGIFMYWLIKMSIWESSGVILLFLLITFGNDSAAWLSGSLFGANNRGLIPASPKKSIAGFIGGLVGSIIISCGAALLFPFIFSNGDISSKGIVLAVILGLCTGIAATLGDLAESAIKRSCDVKDSGKIMFGRGGVLDTIDSISVASPVFFILYYLFFNIQ